MLNVTIGAISRWRSLSVAGEVAESEVAGACYYRLSQSVAAEVVEVEEIGVVVRKSGRGVWLVWRITIFPFLPVIFFIKTLINTLSRSRNIFLSSSLSYD